MIRGETAVGTQPAVDSAPGFENLTETLAQPEEFAEPTLGQVGRGPQERGRRAPRLGGDFDLDDRDGEEEEFGLAFDDDLFGSGILSGEEAARSLNEEFRF